MRTENIPVKIFENSKDASVLVAKEIAELINSRAKEGKNAVLGLATGSTPTRVYNELVRMHKEEGLSFRNVVTFNLDEYYPISKDSLQSYNRFMKEYLFDHIDIKPENIHIPDGTLSFEEVKGFCQRYEEKILEVGGIDIQVLGIGRTGHIGFNEPGSGIGSRTRLITLDKVTRTDAASDFFGEENVPRTAITMGVGTILDARKIFMMAWGETKSAIIRRSVEGECSDHVPATYLQEHDNVQVVVDKAAGSLLTREHTPWLLDEIQWDDKAIRKAVIWLCQKLNKPILKLSDEDYNEHGMGSLSALYGPAYDINLKVFNELQRSITGWPGGKPGSEHERRPERAQPFPKKALIFSPHPDDDVISMGGTLIRLVDQGHDVHVAYQTSGNIAVFDDEAIRFADFVKDYNQVFNPDNQIASGVFEEMIRFLQDKTPGEPDSPEIREIKGLIRRGEAKSACRESGVPGENAYFLDMPFYETGVVKKKDIGEEDIQIIVDLLEKVKPHQVYAAGDLSDPHGTHRVCLKAIFEALERVKDQEWAKDCYVWLYRGAWQEWEIENIEMAVPLSPDELKRKRRAIFKHQSQKDRPLFPGHDQREFWQRAEDRNRTTARTYDELGLAEYEGIEAFVQYKFR